MPVVIDVGDVSLFQVPRRGWLLNMSIVKLPSGGVLVHSPTDGGEDVFAAVERIGAPAILLAPNHYHHLSLPAYRRRFPQARAVCSDGARPRLTKKGHADLGKLEDVQLPPGARFIVLPHLKNGEVWLSLPGDGGPTWIVCDGFFNMPAVHGFMGFLLRRLDVAPGLKLGRSFKWLMRDKRAHRAWLLELLATERPARLIPSHGDPLVENATERLIAETERSLPA